MSTKQATTKVSADDLRAEIRKEYAKVALDSHKGYHFHTAREALGTQNHCFNLFNVPKMLIRG